MEGRRKYKESRTNKLKKGPKRCRIKLVKRLEDGLFRNAVDESTAVMKTSEIKAKRTAFRKHIEEKQTEGSDTNNSEESNSGP